MAMVDITAMILPDAAVRQAESPPEITPEMATQVATLFGGPPAAASG